MQSWNRGYLENVCKAAAAVYTKQAYWGDSGIAPLLHCLGSKWEVSGRLYSRSNNHQWPLNRRVGGPRAGLDVLKKRKTVAPAINRTPAHSLVM